MLKVDRVVWDLVTSHIAADDRFAARLTCRDLAAALDANNSTTISKIRIGVWVESLLHTPVSLQHSIKHLEANIVNGQDWSVLLRFVHQLPQLRSLTCTGRRTWPPQLPQDSSTIVPHSQLRAVRFEGQLTSLVELSVLAPHLDTLRCRVLMLWAQGVGNDSSSAPGVLPCCRSFAAETVCITGDKADAGQAFAAALPQLRVLVDSPAFTHRLPVGYRMHTDVLPLQQALAGCSNLQAIRAFGSSTAMGGLLPLQLRNMPRLQLLSVYGVGPAVELLGMNQMTNLTALILAFELPDKRYGRKLVCQVGALPELQLLALPAKMLCPKCCPGAREFFEGMLLQRAASDSSSGDAGDAVTAANPSNSVSTTSSSSSSSNEGPFQQLHHLVFLNRPKSSHMRYQCGDYCKHHSLAELQDMARQLAAAVQQGNSSQAAPGAGATPETLLSLSAAGAVVLQNTGQQLHGDRLHQELAPPQQKVQLCVSCGLLDPEPARLNGWCFLPAHPESSSAWGMFGPTAWFC